MPRDPNEPVALTRWIHGEVRVHFRSGHIADVPSSLRGAHSLRKQLEDRQGSDSIGGLHAHSGWVWARNDEVVLAEWVPSADYGWKDTSVEDRRLLEKAGLPYGVLRALADLWGGKGHHKAAYSINAVAALMTIATKQPGMTRDLWDRMAIRLEGDEGARLADPEAIRAAVDDKSEPEPAASPTPGTGGSPGEAPPADHEAGPSDYTSDQHPVERDSDDMGT